VPLGFWTFCCFFKKRQTFLPFLPSNIELIFVFLAAI